MNCFRNDTERDRTAITFFSFVIHIVVVPRGLGIELVFVYYMQCCLKAQGKEVVRW